MTDRSTPAVGAAAPARAATAAEQRRGAALFWLLPETAGRNLLAERDATKDAAPEASGRSAREAI